MTERLSPTAEDAQRELVRVADRLRVIGPRLAARGTPAAEEALGQVRTGLQQLADLAAQAAGEPIRAVPGLAPHALADQVLVLGHDLLAGPAGATDVRRADAVRALVRIRDLL